MAREKKEIPSDEISESDNKVKTVSNAKVNKDGFVPNSTLSEEDFAKYLNKHRT